MTKFWGNVTVLGALTHEGERFYCWIEENLTRHHGIQLLKAILGEFDGNLVLYFDRAGSFFANEVGEFVSGSTKTETVEQTSITRVQGEKRNLRHFLPNLPELDPVEGCWNQLQEWFSTGLWRI